MPVQRVETDAQILACFAVMHQLRPHLARDAFVDLVRGQENEGYRMACVVDENGVVRAVAGYRIYSMLYCGRMLYVDDLVSDAAARSRGYGHELLDWLATLAREQGCQELHLDSGTQRVDAHRFYLRERMSITAFHFTRKLT